MDEGKGRCKEQEVRSEVQRVQSKEQGEELGENKEEGEGKEETK